MPADVIERVHLLANLRDNTGQGLWFSDRNNEMELHNDAVDDNITQNIDDGEYMLRFIPYHDGENDDVEDDIADGLNGESNAEAVGDDLIDHQNGIIAEIAGVQREIAGVEHQVAIEDVGIDNHDDDDDDDDDVENGREIEDVEEEDAEDDMNERYGQRTGRYNLRPCRESNYDHLFVADGVTDVAPLATAQMNIEQGIKVFGEAGIAAVKSELQQLHERKVIRPVHQQNLTMEQSKDAVAYLMFLKRKRCGKVKGRGCADGRKQRSYVTREDAASPTVSTEAIFITALIDAFENREVAIIDVPGAFMQADMDEEVYV